MAAASIKNDMNDTAPVANAFNLGNGTRQAKTHKKKSENVMVIQNDALHNSCPRERCWAHPGSFCFRHVALSSGMAEAHQPVTTFG